MNRDKVIRNTLLKYLDPTLYFQQDFFTTQPKPKRRDCEIVTTKPSSIILSRQSYLNSPQRQKQLQYLKKLDQSPKSPKQDKKDHKKFLTLVSRSKTINTLRASKQKYKKLGCSRRSQRRLNSKSECAAYSQNISGRMNRAHSSKAIGSKNSVYKTNIMTPQTSRGKIILRQQVTPLHINNHQRVSYTPQLSAGKTGFNKQKLVIVYNNNPNIKINPHFNQQNFPRPLIKSQSTQILQKVYPSPRISFQYNNRTINSNQFYPQTLTSRTVSTPINMITPTNKSEIRHSFIRNHQNIHFATPFYAPKINPYPNRPVNIMQGFPNNLVINNTTNSQNNAYAYPIYPVYQIIESRQMITPKKGNFIQQKQANNQQLMHLSREITESNDKRKKAYDRIQKKLDQLSSRTSSLNKFSACNNNTQYLQIVQNKESTANKNQDYQNEMNKGSNSDNKKIIDRLDAIIGKQNDKLSTGRNTPKQQTN